MNQFDILSPEQFQELRKKEQKVEEDKGDAYREFVANCRALTLKANTALTQQTETIRSGEVLNLERNYIGSAGLQAMTTLLSKNNNLSELRLSANGIGNDAVVFLCRSMRDHPKLKKIDLSSNDSISLAGGLALLSLVQQNPHIQEIDLTGSQVPQPVLTKIERGLEKNRAMPPTANYTRTASSPSLGIAELSDRQRLREESRMDRWRQKEAQQLHKLKEIIPNMARNGYVPPPIPGSGWRVLEIAIIAPPGIFESEREVLLEKVFPRLNEEMKSRRVLLVPTVNAADSPPGVYLRQLRFSLSCDLVADVRRSRFACIELIGDRAGDYQQPPSNKMIDAALNGIVTATLTANGTVDDVVSAMDPSAPPLHPVIYTAHQEMMKKTNWIIVATRRTTRRLGVPPSLAPLLSGEPPIEHPDKHKSLVKKLAIETTLCKPNTTTTLTATTTNEATTTTVSAVVNVEPTSRIGCSHRVEQLKWDEHQAFKHEVLSTAPVPELIVEDYQANFDSTKSTGDIAMKDLDDFVESIYQRLSILLTSTFPVVEVDSQDHFAGLLALQKLHCSRMFQRAVDHGFCTLMAQNGGHKKTITNRLNLYVATPPSRNSLFLHSLFPEVLTPLVSVCAARHINSVGNHTVAVHSTRYATIYDEPTDLRSVIVHILSQLTSNPEVLRYIRNEVDIKKLKRFFSDFLSGGTRTEEQLPSGVPKVTANTISTMGDTAQVLLVILDGLDAIDPLVEPCPALRQSETGEDVWDAELPESWRTRDDGVDFIPKCLARNVRLIASSNTSSHLLDRLRVRGRDSCEFLDAGDSTANDIEVMLCPSTLEKFNVVLSDDDHTLAQRKTDSGNPEYMRYLIDAVRQLGEVPNFVKQTELIASFPEDVMGAASRLLQNLYATFGQPLITKALGLLTCSRWGLLLPDFRALMKLPPKRMNELLRCLRPVIETFSSSEVGEASGNVALCVVRIVSPSFLELLESVKFQLEGSEEDEKVWHTILAQHYQSVIFGATSEEKSLIYGRVPSSPYETHAVKEFTYHATKAKMWSVIDALVLSIKYLMLVYRNGLAYSYLRDLIFCFNERNVARLLEGDGPAESGSDSKMKNRGANGLLSPALNRMKDFIKFVRSFSFILLEYPHLVLQVALENLEEEGNSVNAEAMSYVRKYFYSYHGESSSTFFRIVETKKKPKLHMGEISSVAFAWNRRHVITGGSDRALSWVEPNTGKVPYQVHQPSARVRVVLFCSTSAYVAAMAVNRSVYIFDSAFGKLISKNEGDDFSSPVSAFSFSSRGRYYLVATEDLMVRVYDSEKGALLFSLTGAEVASPDEIPEIYQKRNVVELLCNPIDDEMFYTIVNQHVCVWRIVETRDGCSCKATLKVPCLCSNPQWCWEPNTPGGDEGILDRSRYLLSQADDYTITLTDMFNSRTVAEFKVRMILDKDLCEDTETSFYVFTKFTVSPDHKLLAAATKEGWIAVFQIDWEFICSVDSETVISTTLPVKILDAFRRTAHPVITDLAFRYNSKSVFALGNDHHMKYWVLPPDVCQRHSEVETNTEYVSPDHIIRETDGDYVHPVKMTAMAVSRLAENDMVEVALGDVSGQLVLLKLFVPSH